jgi:hypothetical protein
MGGRAGAWAGAERSETTVSDQTLNHPVLGHLQGNGENPFINRNYHAK